MMQTQHEMDLFLQIFKNLDKLSKDIIYICGTTILFYAINEAKELFFTLASSYVISIHTYLCIDRPISLNINIYKSTA